MITPSGLKGFTGILKNEKGNKIRIAVVYYKLNAFLFSGEVEDSDNFIKTDELLKESINTFRHNNLSLKSYKKIRGMLFNKLRTFLRK